MPTGWSPRSGGLPGDERPVAPVGARDVDDALVGDRSDPGVVSRPSGRSAGLTLCGEIGFNLGWASGMSEALVPVAEAAGQVVVEDGGADLEEELGSGW